TRLKSYRGGRERHFAQASRKAELALRSATSKEDFEVLPMFVIIGILVVFGAVVAGYLMEHGNLRVLLQPAELVIIGGASIGTVRVANPLPILKNVASGVA